MRALRIHEAASDEAAEAAAWHEKERPGPGAEFEHAVDAALDLLEEEIVPFGQKRSFGRSLNHLNQVFSS